MFWNSFFRASAPTTNPQTGVAEIEEPLVLESHEVDDFEAVNVRLPSYAEACELKVPGANRRELAVRPYVPVEDEALISQLSSDTLPTGPVRPRRASSHVMDNVELDSDYETAGDIVVKTSKPRHRRCRRRSAEKSAVMHARREADRVRDRSKMNKVLMVRAT